MKNNFSTCITREKAYKQLGNERKNLKLHFCIFEAMSSKRMNKSLCQNKILILLKAERLLLLASYLTIMCLEMLLKITCMLNLPLNSFLSLYARQETTGRTYYQRFFFPSPISPSNFTSVLVVGLLKMNYLSLSTYSHTVLVL